MDAIDERLLLALRENGRASTAQLARLVGRSRTSVQSRIERLEKQGIIVGYQVLLAPEHVEMPTSLRRLIERINVVQELPIDHQRVSRLIGGRFVVPTLPNRSEGVGPRGGLPGETRSQEQRKDLRT